GAAVTAGVATCDDPAETATLPLFLKHWRQRTGRPCVGLKGTVVETPHSEHSVRVSVREMPAAEGPAVAAGACPPWARRDLHGLQRLGSFLNCLSWKKSCSRAVKTNSPPQSTQVRILSMYSIAGSPVRTEHCHTCDAGHARRVSKRSCNFKRWMSLCRGEWSAAHKFASCRPVLLAGRSAGSSGH